MANRTLLKNTSTSQRVFRMIMRFYFRNRHEEGSDQGCGLSDKSCTQLMDVNC